MKASGIILWSVVAVLVTHIVFFGISYLLIFATRHSPYDTTPGDCCLPVVLKHKEVCFPSPHGRIPDSNINIRGWYFEAYTTSGAAAEIGAAADSGVLREICRMHPELCGVYNSTNNNATIVVVHGHGANMGKLTGTEKSVIHKAILPFYAAGYNVLAIDLRNHGTSDDALPVSLGLYEYLDVISAIEWVKHNTTNDKNRIAVWGESMGAATVIFAASQPQTDIKAIVCDSSFSSVKEAFKGHIADIPLIITDYLWKCITMVFPYTMSDVRPVDAVKNVRCPIFIIHGVTDGLIPSTHANVLVEASKTRQICLGNNKCVTKEMYHNGTHVRTYEYPDVIAAVLDFMQQHV